jgi:hypothetical protein
MVVTAVLAAVGPLAAQGPRRVRYDFELDGSAISSMPLIGSVGSTLRGITFGGEGRAALGPVGLAVGYWQGHLSADAGPAQSEDVVEGKVLLTVQPVHWLTFGVGPFARAYTTSAGTERWFTWRVQARADGVIVPAVVRGYAELWAVASTSVNVVQPFSSGQGGEVGMRIYPPRWPVWLRLGYGIEQIKLGSGSRLDTVDRLTLGVGYSGR